ncbi:hypothetical protein YC2023_077546 [Brassica napus]
METFCCVRWSRLLCFYGIFSIGSCSTIRFVQIRCFGLGAKPQSTWRLHSTLPSVVRGQSTNAPRFGREDKEI